MLRIEDRLKLVNASAAFYRTSQQVTLPVWVYLFFHLSVCLSLYLFYLSLQVCGVLESLEQEYRREEDWCGGGDRQPEQLLPLINKHMEQKEAFLKVRRAGKALESLGLSLKKHYKPFIIFYKRHLSYYPLPEHWFSFSLGFHL